MHLPVAKVGNLADSIKKLKKAGVWIYGADMNGEDYQTCDYPPAIALVVGAEGQGLSHNIRGLCDKIVSIPMKGRIESLNASVSAGILIFDIASKRE
jgi:23S rRNA (guanosine2251-2'-O)-methyltransferase